MPSGQPENGRPVEAARFFCPRNHEDRRFRMIGTARRLVDELIFIQNLKFCESCAVSHKVAWHGMQTASVPVSFINLKALRIRATSTLGMRGEQ